MTDTVSKEDYDLCDQENSNLRRALAWAGTKLTHEQRQELAHMIERYINDGGVTRDGQEDDREHLLEVKRLTVKAAETLRQVVDVRSLDELMSTGWYVRAEDLANRLMEFDPPTNEATLHEVRNMEKLDRAVRGKR